MTNNEQVMQPFWLTMNQRKASTRATLRQSNQGSQTAMKGRTRNTAR